MDILKGVTFEKLVNFVHDKQVSITLTIEPGHTSIDIYPYMELHTMDEILEGTGFKEEEE